jgi:ADP-L-glycero-D-manno-heptose 6-epimerase
VILVTGAAGFIGSCLIQRLNQLGRNDLVVVDNAFTAKKAANLESKSWTLKLQREELPAWLHENHQQVEWIYHFGARTDTTEQNVELFNELNLGSSKTLWDACSRWSIPFVYASSAATYGLGDLGFEDGHDIVEQLRPLNPYAISKNDFDKWALQQEKSPPFWAGLKFFNVYGPNESHKNMMASVVFHAFNQIKETGQVKLFRSHRPDYQDGEQLRDFIYVQDVLDICLFLRKKGIPSGLINVGTGQSRTFLDLARATFAALNSPAQIKFIDTPMRLRKHYQYRTCANIKKLRTLGYTAPFTPLEDGIRSYIQDYLVPDKKC